ncbi:MAG: TVP38/TMEM64 family protein [Rhodospirillaceae bacterium]
MTEIEQAAAARKVSRARLAILLAIPALAVALVAAGVTDQLSLDRLNAHRATLNAFVAERRALAALIYVGVYFAGVALSIPGWGLLTVFGGFLFGPLLGTALVVVAATAGGTVVFLAGRYALGDFLRARAAPAIRKLEAGFQENEFSYLLALRLTPVLPFFVTTFALSFLNIRLRNFLPATVLGLIPITLVYATLGAGLHDALETGAEDPLAAAREPLVMAGLAGLALLALLPVALKRWRSRRAARQRGYADTGSSG